MNIGLVTYAEQPELTDDDRPLIGAFGEIGVTAAAVRWDDASVNWRDYDAVVLRSTWDYHLRVAEFTAWLATLELERVPLWNPVPLVRWNMHKRYLHDLESAGVLIPDTCWLTKGTAMGLRDILAARGWHEAIVKPAISASATDTWRVRADDAEDANRLAALASRSDVLVQEVVPEVARDGEWSLVFIGERFSHATLKKPKPGDFRVQLELGGSADPATAPSMLIAAAERVAAHIPRPWLYARIDGVVTQRGFLLMEIECIEPLLFFAHAPGSYERFAAALTADLRRASSSR